MLRSSSTPVLGSLLVSSSSSSHYVPEVPVELPHHGKLPSPHRATPISCSSSPVIDSSSGKGGGGGFRRVQSEGKLEFTRSDGNQGIPHTATRSRGSVKILDSIPSFSFSSGGCEDKDEDEDDAASKASDVGCGEVARYSMMCAGSLGSVVLEKRDGVRQEVMYLAKGLGISGNSGHGSCDFEGGFGGGSGRHGGSSSGGGGGSRGGDGYGLDLEGHYKKMVEDDPGNPLLLRNYAQFLYKVKGDLEKAEEYYSRAVLTDPGDGEILSQYAKLVWELHHDRGMALSYFERAARASPEDSHVQAAYAGFLWDAEDDNNEGEAEPNLKVHKPLPRYAFVGHSLESDPYH